MISNYVRDNSFFQSLSESNSDISYKDFDNELNNFVNYLNKKVVTAINNIKNNSYNGVIGNKNYIIRNIGNGKVLFDKLKDINFLNNSIEINKIKKITPYCLLVTDELGSLVEYNTPQLPITRNNPVYDNYSTIYNERYKSYQFAAGKRDALYNNSIVTSGVISGNAFSWALANSNRDFYSFLANELKIPFEEVKSEANIRLVNNLNTNYAEYWTQRRLADEYQKEYERLSSLIEITPKNIFFSKIPIIYDGNVGGLKITSNRFYNKSIKSHNIDANTITKDHISNFGKLFLLKNIKIENKHIINNTIPNDKFSYYSITYNKLHPDIKNYRENVVLKYLDSSIPEEKIKNNSFDFDLITSNLNRFGYGILHKKVIPLNSVVIQKPDVTFTETIDTFKLCIYSIANAYQLNTYTDPQPDSIYVNPDFINYVNQYNDMYKKYQDAALRRDTLYNNSVVTTSGRSYNAFSWALQNPTHGFIWFFENYLKISSTTPDNVRIINNLNTNYAQYWTERRLADEYQKEYERLSILISNTPKNIYQAQPPLVYQRLEAVPNTKSYVLNMEQQVIKSKHLKDNMLSMYQIPDRINYNNVPSEKFINKYMLSPELRTKLGLVI